MTPRMRTAPIAAVLTAIAALLAACALRETPAGDGASRGAAAARPAGRTLVYHCPDGFRFTARIEGESAWLFLPQRTVRLPQVPSASGARYSDGGTTYWSKGEEAQLTSDGHTRKGCQNHRAEAVWEDAKLRGVGFRAVGQEPGWHLEITPGARMVLVMDYGARRYEFPTPDPVEDPAAGTTVYHAQARGHSLRIELQGGGCQDTMSGERFETTLRMELDGRSFTGCGRPLH